MKTVNRLEVASERSLFRSDLAVLIYLSFFYLILHLLVNGQYGYFRDELAYLDDAKRLDWGYVDHPPLAPFLGSISHRLFGDWLVGLRFWPALSGAGVVFVTGLVARELGGGRLAQIVAVLCVFGSSASEIFGVLFQAAAFEQLWWAIICFLFVRLLKTDNPRLWLAIGPVVGLSLMTKYSVVFYLIALGLALLLTPARKHLLTPWPWLGAGLAGLIFLPNLLWLIQHDFVSLDYTRSINARDVSIGRSDGFLLQQIYQITSPLSLPIWLAGLYYLLVKVPRYRLLGLVYLVVLGLFLVLQGRSYYLAPAYPVLYAAGSLMFESWVRRGSRLKYAYLGLLVVGSVLTSPIGLPVLPAGSDPWRTVVKVNDSFAEMVGWEELVATTAQVYRGLPAQEQSRTAILAGNYGEAGAVNLYGPAYGLPQAISPVNSYYDWSKGRLQADTYIVLGYTRPGLPRLQAICGDVQPVVSSITNRYNIENEETNYQIYLCRNLKTPLAELWPDMRRYA